MKALVRDYDTDELVLNPIDIKTRKGIIRSLVKTNSNQRIKMKSTKLFAFALSLASLMYLTACDDNNNHRSTNTGTIAPAGFGARTMAVAVNDGAAPFSNTGTYTLTTQGAARDTSGNYTITGDGAAIGDSTGTYTYNRTGTNTANLVLQDSSLGTVNSVLTFDSANSGSLTSTDSGTGTQSGTFTTQ
ncbi:MAG: hypothetical protein JWM16_1359 [Verrucomicrobiales bacterium]|nr:hypothetical protein [Verrucomicrobiales bacterium]